jgi:uncharacterized protein GlcG (DUF336 family)
MQRVLTWEEATRLADHIASTPDAGNWHVGVAVVGAPGEYAVTVRQHRTDTLHYVSSVTEFAAVCAQASGR